VARGEADAAHRPASAGGRLALTACSAPAVCRGSAAAVEPLLWTAFAVAAAPRSWAICGRGQGGHQSMSTRYRPSGWHSTRCEHGTWQSVGRTKRAKRPVGTGSSVSGSYPNHCPRQAHCPPPQFRRLFTTASARSATPGWPELAGGPATRALVPAKPFASHGATQDRHGKPTAAVATVPRYRRGRDSAPIRLRHRTLSLGRCHVLDVIVVLVSLDAC